jgi:hypothetical protein
VPVLVKRLQAPVSYRGFTLNRRSVWHGCGTAKQCGSYGVLAHACASESSRLPPTSRLGSSLGRCRLDDQIYCRILRALARVLVLAIIAQPDFLTGGSGFTDGYLCHLAVCPDLGSSWGSPTAAPDLSHVCPAPGRLRHRAEAGAEHGMAGALNWCAAP